MKSKIVYNHLTSSVTIYNGVPMVTLSNALFACNMCEEEAEQRVLKKLTKQTSVTECPQSRCNRRPCCRPCSPCNNEPTRPGWSIFDDDDRDDSDDD